MIILVWLAVLVALMLTGQAFGDSLYGPDSPEGFWMGIGVWAIFLGVSYIAVGRKGK